MSFSSALTSVSSWYSALGCGVWSLVLSVALVSNALAGPVEERIREQVRVHTKGKVSVDQVLPTPVPGIFEVVSGTEIFYTDATGRHAFVDGRLIDLATEKDLTAARLDQINRVAFEELPLRLAIKQVRGTGRRVLAVFEDPGCPACRVLHKFIAQLDDVTVYHFMYPVTDPQSVNKARAVWCAPNRREAWLRLMEGGVAPAVPPGCNVEGLQQIVTLGDQLKILGTPTVFLGNGQRLVGATPPEQFLAALDQSVGARP